MDEKTLAEVLWNLEGAPEVNDEEYDRKYLADAKQQLQAAANGEIEPWWEAPE